MSDSLLESIRRGGQELLEKIKDTFDDSKIGEICIPCMLATSAKGLGLLPGLGKGNKYSAYNLEMLAKSQKSALYFSGQQSNKDTCALMSAESVLYEHTGDRHPAGAEALRSGLRPGINLADGTSKFEKEMIGLGEKSGGYTFCSGTTDESKILTAAGIPATETPEPSVDVIASAVEEGRAVLVAYDARPVWGAVSPRPLGHAVRVTGVERDSDGNVSALYINDSGDGTAPKRIPAATFQRALDGFGGGRMAVSDAPLFAPVETPAGGSL